ncbi:MAG: ABC transporter permease [Candidatus Saganbacteria bacterium]|nr:ABC transporter permease [Candidatus Saganbacteria bacterium]
MIKKFFDSRLFHFMKKEFLQLTRDPRMLAVALIAPAIQLLILGYVASTDIKHVPTAVFDESRTYYSREYLASFTNSGYFDLNYYVNDIKELTALIDGGEAKLGLHIPPDFGQKLVNDQGTAVQALIDGTNSSTASIVQGYASQINFNNANAILEQRLAKTGLSASGSELLDVQQRIWYNPELKSINFMVPAVFAQVLMIISMILSASSIVKEKESGTMEMLAVTPLKPYELILGKLLPFAIVAFIQIALVYLVADFWFSVPLKGSIFLLFGLGGLFMMTGLGMGLFISTVSQTQRQALMTNNLILAPQMTLSGFIFPIANMPWFIQLLTYFIPVRYFLVIVRDIFLKGTGLNYLWPQVWPMTLIGVLLLAFSILRFKKKLE